MGGLAPPWQYHRVVFLILAGVLHTFSKGAVYGGARRNDVFLILAAFLWLKSASGIFAIFDVHRQSRSGLSGGTAKICSWLQPQPLLPPLPIQGRSPRLLFIASLEGAAGRGLFENTFWLQPEHYFRDWPYLRLL